MLLLESRPAAHLNNNDPICSTKLEFVSSVVFHNFFFIINLWHDKLAKEPLTYFAKFAQDVPLNQVLYLSSALPDLIFRSTLCKKAEGSFHSALQVRGSRCTAALMQSALSKFLCHPRALTGARRQRLPWGAFCSPRLFPGYRSILGCDLPTVPIGQVLFASCRLQINFFPRLA